MAVKLFTKSNRATPCSPRTFFAAFALSLAISHGQETVITSKPAKPSAPAFLPGKSLAQYDFFYAGEAR
jgi:hypothetical protein